MPSERRGSVERKWSSGESECRASWADWFDCVCVLYLTAVWPSPSAPSPPLHPKLPSFTSAPLQSVPPSPADWWAVGLWHSSAEHTHSQRTSDPSLTQPWPRLECYRSFDTHSRKQTQGSLCLHSVLLNKGERLELLAEFQDFQQSKIVEEWTCESLSNYCFLLLCKFTLTPDSDLYGIKW